MVDFYQIGALLFELLSGLPPCFNKDKLKMYKQIAEAEPDYRKLPAETSSECLNFLKSCLQKNPLRRLGAKKGI